MPPRKKQRISSSNLKTSQPQNVSEVAAGRLQLRDWIAVVHQGRHGYPEKRKFPLNDGGSFLDVVQRCWCDEDALITDSLALVKKLGIMDSSSTEEDFMNKYLKMKDQSCMSNTSPRFIIIILCHCLVRWSNKISWDLLPCNGAGWIPMLKPDTHHPASFDGIVW